MTAPSQNHIRALTGMRFVAALSVFSHHLLGRFGITNFNCPLGDGGVTFFFVLSGFILTYVYTHRLTSYRDFGRFYFTRWARIWPLHIVTLLIYIYFLVELKYFFDTPEAMQKLVLNVLLLQSWVPNYAWVFDYNGVSWSISTEAYFYLMFPLLAFKRRWFWIKYLLVTVAIAGYLMAVYLFSDAINESGWASVQPLVHCFPFVRLFEFMTGMATGYLFLARPNLTAVNVLSNRSFWKDSLIELGAVALLLAYYHWQFNLPQTVQLPQALSVLRAKSGAVFFYAILIYFFSHTRGILGRFWGSRVMVYLGEVSFAFYMIHFVVILLLSNYQFAPLPMYYGGLATAALVLSVACASLLYHFVEMPAKASLMAWYDRGFWASASETLTRFKAAVLTPVVWAAVVAIWMVLGVLQMWTIDNISNQQVIDNVKQTELFRHPIHFDSEAVLFGIVANETDDSIEIQLTWIKKRSNGRQRLLEILSQDDQMLHTLYDVHQRFNDAPVGEVFVESINVSKQKFSENSRLCLAFFSIEEKMGKISGGPRSTYNRRLNLHTNEGPR